MIGQFKMECGTNGFPDKNTIETAKYLISLFKAQPQNGTENNIYLTGSTTRQQTRDQFKLLAGTTMEDIFIGLKQAEERQVIKDRIDDQIDFLHLREFEFYNELGLNDLYTKVISILTHNDFKIASTSGQYCYYKNKTVFLTADSDIVTIVHELVHAYTDIILGGMSRKDDEMLATMASEILCADVIKPLKDWENCINKPNVTEAELAMAWNKLWYVSDNNSRSLPVWISLITSDYRNNIFESPSKYQQTPKLKNLIDVKNIFGVYFSPKKVFDYSKSKLPSGYTPPMDKPPFGYEY
jgi:hypothetical protein